MPEQHALLSASSSERWLNCPPSARLGETFPETTSTYAEAGWVAHAIGELKARKYFVEPMSTRTYNSQMKKLQADPHYDKGMDGSTDEYLEYLKSIAMSFGSTPPFVALETRVDYGHIAPEGFGTTDCIIIGAGQLHVCDYKNGSGVLVEAEHNSQMMLYALGALKVYQPIYGNTIQEIHLHIIQPNAGGIRAWSLTRAELEEWGINYVSPRAALAFAGEGEFCPGEWCRFCPTKARCSARAAQMLELEEYSQNYLKVDAMKAGSSRFVQEVVNLSTNTLLTDAEVGDILTRALNLEAWVKDLKEYAFTAALAGREIAGFKLVEGRGSRDWTDLDKAFKTLKERDVSEALLWERKPVTPPALETALGKKLFKESVADLVTKTPGKPTLVPASDPRKPYNAAQVAFGGAADG